MHSRTSSGTSAARASLSALPPLALRVDPGRGPGSDVDAPSERVYGAAVDGRPPRPCRSPAAASAPSPQAPPPRCPSSDTVLPYGEGTEFALERPVSGRDGGRGALTPALAVRRCDMVLPPDSNEEHFEGRTCGPCMASQLLSHTISTHGTQV